MYSIYLCFVWVTFFVIVTSGESATLSSSSFNDGTYCDGTGWALYRDEKCYKLIENWTSRNQAKEMCAQEGLQSDGSIPQLATIKSADEQAFLTELVFGLADVSINVWLGAKRSQNGNNKFTWDDGSEVGGEFTNWAEGSPTGEIRQSCVVMKSHYMKSPNTAGQWRDVPCDAPNYVICEKLPRWSITKLQQTLLETRKELKVSNDLLSKQLDDTINELSVTKNQLSQSTNRLDGAIEETKQKLIPIGFLYTQLPSEKAPSEIWSWMTWQDVSSAYAGVFFRVNGGGSASFGTEQPENVPRITHVQNNGHACYNDGTVQTVVGDWSRLIYSGGFGNGMICLRFQMSGGEVRPRNMAVRIWKRTG